jgi:tRNA pseudouridine55 synthase
MNHFGILNMNKPTGCTSRGVVNHVARLCRPAKAGHAGTLDPLATGVLVICVGQATRLIKYLQQMRKVYRATFLLGHQSETDDVEASVTVLNDAPRPTLAAIELALLQFLGTIQQRPPAYSALKVAGRRAYQLARQGAEVDLALRSVTVYRLRALRYMYPELELEIECSSGTYVRALGRDLAATLSTTAVMSALVRTSVGTFCLDRAVQSDQLTHETLARHMQPPLAAVSELPQVVLDDAEIVEIRHGRPVDVISRSPSPTSSHAEWAAIDRSGRLIAILQHKRPQQFWPAINFHPQPQS